MTRPPSSDHGLARTWTDAGGAWLAPSVNLSEEAPRGGGEARAQKKRQRRSRRLRFARVTRRVRVSVPPSAEALYLPAAWRVQNGVSLHDKLPGARAARGARRVPRPPSLNSGGISEGLRENPLSALPRRRRQAVPPRWLLSQPCPQRGGGRLLAAAAWPAGCRQHSGLVPLPPRGRGRASAPLDEEITPFVLGTRPIQLRR